jgi:long-subunit fatty acid transport protein
MPDVWKVVGEYTFTQYNRNSILAIAGNLTTASGPLPIPSIPQNWSNQSNFRFGTEFKLMPSWAIRAGYVLTTQVVPDNSARVTFSSPGLGHSFALGAGTTVLPKLNADLSLEYSRASGTVTADDNPITGVNTGDYSSNAYAAHLGLTYQI